MKQDVRTRVAAAARMVREWAGRDFPGFGIVLGSGLAAAAGRVREPRFLPFHQIPGCPLCSAPGHRSRLLLGEIESLPVALLLGRHHLYEGHTPDEAVFTIRLLAALGVKKVLLTAATGGIAPELAVGDFLRIRDQLNLTGASPLTGPEPGPEDRFPDMTRMWDPELAAAVGRAGERIGMPLPVGVYAGVRGPQFETPAEIRMLRALGGDVVGMSVVLEAIAARHAGMRIAGLGFVSNLAAGMGEAELDPAHVEEEGKKASPRLARLLVEIAREPEFRTNPR